MGITAGLYYSHGEREQGDRIIFSARDQVGDDYGPGTYLYPTNEQFKPQEDLFDLHSFQIREEDSWYRFLFTFGKLTNPWQARHGFSHQLIQLYIDNDRGGSTETFVPGAGVSFSESHPWNYLLKISGWGVELFRSDEDPEQAAGEVESELEILDDERTISVRVPVEELGSVDRGSFYLLVGSFDIFGPDNYRQVKEEVGPWHLVVAVTVNTIPMWLTSLLPIISLSRSCLVIGVQRRRGWLSWYLLVAE